MKIDKKLSEETSLKVKEALAKENKEEAIVEAFIFVISANSFLRVSTSPVELLTMVNNYEICSGVKSVFSPLRTLPITS